MISIIDDASFFKQGFEALDFVPCEVFMVIYLKGESYNLIILHPYIDCDLITINNLVASSQTITLKNTDRDLRLMIS